MQAPASVFMWAWRTASKSIVPFRVSSRISSVGDPLGFTHLRMKAGTWPSTHSAEGRIESHRIRDRASTRSRMKSGRTNARA